VEQQRKSIQLEQKQTNTSHKLNHHNHRPEHLFSATLWTTVPSFFAEEKNLRSSRDWIHHNCTTLCRPKGRRRPKTDDEGEVGKVHRSLDDQKEGTVTRINT
jgi:hypothetical protein